MQYLRITSLLALSILLLSSCGMTLQEIEEGKKICESAGSDFRIHIDRVGYACDKRDNKVQKCIDGYIDAIDEKYNNPDTVSNLREDEYSTVVKTCQETFGFTRSDIITK